MSGISIALSGGGHRAALFGLGALLYLVDAGKNSEVTSIASVSGGSLTNGFIAQQTNFRTTTPAAFRAEIAPFVHQLASGGTLFATPLTKAYLAVLALWSGATIVLPWLLVEPLWLRLVTFIAGVIVLGWLAQLRGLVCGKAFASVLFSPHGFPTKLADIAQEVDHVICATDLHAGEHVYFSGRFVCAYRFGWGVPGSLPLHTAVQASAALPGAFPPRWLSISEHRFKDPRPEARNTGHLVLADGGVYDNMGDQWGHGVGERTRRWGAHNPGLAEPSELIVVNASGAMSFQSTSSLRLPLLGELTALLRDKDVLYDNGTSVRRQALVARFDLAEREQRGIKGALVHIPRSPLHAASAFANNSAWPERAARAREVLTCFAGQEQALEQAAKESSAVKTTLSRIGHKTTAMLLRHGYLLAMTNLHVIRGYPLLEAPGLDDFEALCRGQTAPSGEVSKG